MESLGREGPGMWGWNEGTQGWYRVRAERV